MDLSADGRIRVRNGSSSGTILDTTAGVVLVASSWNFIEWKILMANAGTYTVSATARRSSTEPGTRRTARRP